MSTAAAEASSGQDPAWFRFVRGAVRYVAVPVFAFKVLDNASDLASFSLLYDPANAGEAKAKVMVNQLNTDGQGSFWFEYEVDGESYSSRRLTASTFVHNSIAPELIAKYPAGSVVTAKYSKSHPSFAYLEDGHDTVDSKRAAVWLVAFDGLMLFLSYRLFKRVGAISLAKLRR